LSPDQPDLLLWLSGHLVRLGPGVLFFVCVFETAIFAGLILPVGALIAFAALLSARGVFEPGEIILVALLGAFVGDQLGFVVGRWFVSRADPPRGRVAKIWRAALSRTEALVRERGLLGVSVSRAIPFVRTIMPWFAGRSGISWPRFLLFDSVGILLWGTIYIGGGFLAGQGWSELVSRFGEVVGGALLLLVGILVLVLARRGLLRKSLRRRHSAVR
jgi:membrane-associated protein